MYHNKFTKMVIGEAFYLTNNIEFLPFKSEVFLITKSFLRKIEEKAIKVDDLSP